jgi:hypothetical protein
MQILEPVPQIPEFQRTIGTIEIRRAAAGLTCDALKKLPRRRLTISGQTVESEVVLGEVEEFVEGVVRKFPKSLTKFETCSRIHGTPS